MLQRIIPRAALIAAVAAIYVGAARLGLSLAYVHPSATPVWPPTGISLAALLLFGYGVWPGVFIGAFVANVWISGVVAPSLGIALGNTLEAILAAWLVTEFAGGDRVLERARDIFRFAGITLACTLVAALVGPASLGLGGMARWEEFWPIAGTWWMGDFSGALLITPLVLVWAREPATAGEGKRDSLTIPLFAGVLVSGLLVFGGWGPADTRDMPLEFLCLPFLVAIAFRLGVRESVTANALLAAVAIWGTLRGMGPFHRLDPNQSLLLMQAFTGVVALTTIALAAVVAERRRVTHALALLESAVDNAAEGLVILAAGTSAARPRITFTNEGFRKLTGLSAAQALGQTLDILDVAPRDAMASARRAFAVGQSFQTEMSATRPDGTQYALEMEVIPVPATAGRSAYWVAILRDVSERRHHLAALEHQALHDPLTGLPNRLLLGDRLEQSIRAAEREGGSFAVLLIDLDRFKDVNDTYGHAAGDALLAQVGPRLRKVLRSVDTIARVGGDEFVVLLPSAGSAEDVGRTAAKILETLEAPFAVEGHASQVSASVGIALYPQHGAEGLALLRAADAAMYMAKRSSKAYSVYSAGEDAFQRRRLVLLEELRRGIDKGELFLMYQPQVDMRTRRVARAEALVRWRHPERGLVLPDEFISGAERIGLSRRLTDWILEAAIRQARHWQNEGIALPVAVNASTRILRDTNFAERVKALLHDHGVAPERLTLEITESLMAEPLDALATLADLRAVGVRLSIDDFGVGALSLLTLKQLPVEEIKIDKSFVLGMATEMPDAAVVRAIVDLAHHLGCRVVAEGVESEASWNRLAEIGCDIAQGSYVSPPMVGDELAAWFAERHVAAGG